MMDALHPGCHQRHLLRRRDNPLFSEELRRVDDALLAQARQRDADEREAFMQRFHALLEEASGLQANEDSETLLGLKARLDQAYTLLASLGGETAPLKQALRRLTDAIVSSIQRAAAGDHLAAEELAQERLAREQHYRLMEHPLAADLMRPDTPIAPGELAATLLSSPREELEAALWLFGAEELASLCREARQLLAAAGSGPAHANLQLMEAQLPPG